MKSKKTKKAAPRFDRDAWASVYPNGLFWVYERKDHIPAHPMFPGRRTIQVRITELAPKKRRKGDKK